MELELRRIGTLGADARNYFLSPFARIEEIITEEANEDMRFFDADSLACNLSDAVSRDVVRLLSKMSQLIEESSAYEDDYRKYFGVQSVAALDAVIELMKNVPEEAAGLKKIVMELPAYKERMSPFEKAKCRVSVPLSIVQPLRDFQVALSGCRELLATIKQKLDREHVEDEIALRHHE